MRVLVATDDLVGPEMAGSAVRAWELARALAVAGHEVVLAGAPGSTAPAGDGPEVVAAPRWRRADAVVAAPWSLPPAAFLRARRLVVDGVTPLVAELGAMADDPAVRRRRRTATARLPLAAARADAVLVAGDAQAGWWSARLARRPGVPLLRVPFGIPDREPAQERDPLPGVPRDWAVVLWWGGVWPWLDLETLLAARARLGSAPVSLVVPAAPRPGEGPRGLGPEELLAAATRHGLAPPQVVPLERWVPYGERHRVLNRASLLAVLHRGGEETRLSFRTRALDAVWAGVPLVVSEGGEVAERVRAAGWGGVVPVGEPRAAAAALEVLLGEREQRRCRERIAATRGEWRWSRVTEPLVAALPGLPQTPRGALAPALLGAALRLAGLAREARR